VSDCPGPIFFFPVTPIDKPLLFLIGAVIVRYIIRHGLYALRRYFHVWALLGLTATASAQETYTTDDRLDVLIVGVGMLLGFMVLTTVFNRWRI
jgi:hypothetical protein